MLACSDAVYIMHDTAVLFIATVFTQAAPDVVMAVKMMCPMPATFFRTGSNESDDAEESPEIKSGESSMKWHTEISNFIAAWTPGFLRKYVHGADEKKVS